MARWLDFLKETCQHFRMITKDHPLFDQFDSLVCRLSPENLHCDGECTRAEAHRRYKRIMAEWAALEKKAGFKVTREEVENIAFAAWRS
jgi:hypothetical protein